MVGRVAGPAERKERKPLGQFVAVEQDLVGPAGARLPADQRVLTALAVAGEIGERTIRTGGRPIVLLDSTLHLREQPLLQRNRIGERVLGMSVLRLQMRADRGIELVGIAQHLLPVRGLEPGELIGGRDAVPCRGDRPLLGARFLRRGRAFEHGRAHRFCGDR